MVMPQLAIRRRDDDMSPPDIRQYALELGLRLEVNCVGGRLAIVAYELQTGIRVKDLPGMDDIGGWWTWAESLAGLCQVR